MLIVLKKISHQKKKEESTWTIKTIKNAKLCRYISDSLVMVNSNKFNF